MAWNCLATYITQKGFQHPSKNLPGALRTMLDVVNGDPHSMNLAAPCTPDTYAS